MENAEKEEITQSKDAALKGALIYIREFLKERTSISQYADKEATTEGILKDIEFKGPNLWILVFSIFIASVGLNMNSTAVIIGAMLISPLMGPILGIGFAVGTNDFRTLTKSLRNLGIAVVFAVLTSAFYFWVSPLNDEQSELLARTRPTIFDVLIAIFGGLTGIIAGSRKEKTNVVPGVAIATALMPPLCTAGYGIATLKLNFFLGAFYLFFINSVFISLSTLLVVRFLKFPKKTFVDPKKERQVKIYIILFVVITIIPSTIIAYRVVQESLFNDRIKTYLEENAKFNNAHIFDTKITYDSDSSTVELFVDGDVVSDFTIAEMNARLIKYDIEKTTVLVNQLKKDDEAKYNEWNQRVRAEFFEDLFAKNEEKLQTKDEHIKMLEEELLRQKRKQYPVPKVSKELQLLFPGVQRFSFTEVLETNVETQQSDTISLAIIKLKTEKDTIDLDKLSNFLRVRLEVDSVQTIITDWIRQKPESLPKADLKSGKKKKSKKAAE